EHNPAIQVELAGKKVHLGFVILLHRMGAHHQETHVPSLLSENFRRAQIPVDPFSRNDAPDASTYRNPRRNAEFLADRAMIPSATWLGDIDAVANDLDLSFVNALLDQPGPPCGAVGQNTIRETACELQRPNLRGCHVCAGVANGSDDCRPGRQPRGWNR